MQPMALPFITFLVVAGAFIVPQLDARKSTFTPPDLAAIVAGGKYLCSATIIDDYFVLTAGSCIENLDVNSTEVYVHVGTKSQVNGLRTYAQSIRAVKIFVDNSSNVNPTGGPGPHASSSVSGGYLGMVQVESRFQYTGNVLWASPTLQDISTSLEGVVGIWSGTKLTTKTKTAPVEAISSSSCSTYLNSVTLNSTQTCLKPTISTSRPCKADLGAPFYVDGLLYGVVTYDLGCKSTSYPTIVTATAGVANFVFQSITGLSSNM